MHTREDVVTVRQLDDLVLDERSVDAQVPQPAILLHDVTVDRDFPTAVGNRTDVLVDSHVVVVLIV